MRAAPRKFFYASTLLVAFCVCFASANAQRVVFAHFMLANQDYVSADAPSEAVIASYEREILYLLFRLFAKRSPKHQAGRTRGLIHMSDDSAGLLHRGPHPKRHRVHIQQA
jgi:hypothetical protein